VAPQNLMVLILDGAAMVMGIFGNLGQGFDYFCFFTWVDEFFLVLWGRVEVE
jgi:hypothetical protein